MSYYFIEDKYPDHDPNIDLNFENDILYGALRGDEIDKYNTGNAIIPDIQPSANQDKHNIRTKKKSVGSNTRIYVVFIFFVILVLLLWYMYGGKAEPKKPDVIDTYPDKPEISMMSPDFGMGARYGRI